MRKIIYTPDAPSLWTQATKVGNHIYVAGTAGMDPKTNHLVGATVEEQTHQALRNCEAILKAAGASLDDVVQVTILLREPEDSRGMQGEINKTFPDSRPSQIVGKLGVIRDIEGIPLRVSVSMTAIIE